MLAVELLCLLPDERRHAVHLQLGVDPHRGEAELGARPRVPVEELQRPRAKRVADNVLAPDMSAMFDKDLNGCTCRILLLVVHPHLKNL